MAGMPKFRRFSDGKLILGYTNAAREVMKKTDKPTGYSKLPEEIRKQALKVVLEKGGDVGNDSEVQGEYLLQFGQCRGQTFRWMLENALGYVGWLINSTRSESTTTAAISQNKAAFKRYAESFEEVRQVVALKKAELEGKQPAQQRINPKTSLSPSLAAGLASGRLSKDQFLAKVTKQAATRFRPNIPPSSPKRPSTATCRKSLQLTSVDDEELCALVDQMEKDIETPVEMSLPKPSKQVPITTPSRQVPVQATLSVDTLEDEPKTSYQEHPLPEGWRRSLPKADHHWVSQALFKKNAKTGKAELDFSRVNKLWWDPPQPPLVTTQPPRPNKYFAQRLLLWMPRKLWKVKLYCPHSDCNKRELTSAGIYQNIRQVLDIDQKYNLAAEYLECRSCMKKVISWSPVIVKQLDPGHQLQFPVLITYQYACDVRVIKLLRQRGLGNSSTQLQKKLSEQHGEKWLQRSIQYLTECKYFADACKSGLVTAQEFEDPPDFVPVPKYKWFLTVYVQDIMSRIDHIKASITSTFGTIIKMDSTKKIVKKLAGHSSGTASWATNVGNEMGQVMMSVLTASEGVGLVPMANGLMRRYSDAGVPPPKVLYVDRDCCGGNLIRTNELFSLWEDLVVRLDIWHLMRRFASCCTTESHQLYGQFLSRLSKCIFQWSTEDLHLLKKAKRNELEQQGILHASDADVVQRISKRELALHCRRKTRGVVETTELLHALLVAFAGEQGCDTLGVPLLDEEQMLEIWNSQKQHIECIQDPDGVQLYVETGTLTKGGIKLPTYRCARGSTSLESFHLHINRFIPGTSASDMHFQAYLLEGLSRWNADRASNAVSAVSTGPQVYCGVLTQAANELSESVLGKKIKPDVQEMGIYTGEPIGVEYLFNQTGQVLQDITLEDEDADAAEPLSEVDVDQLDEGFVDNDDETVGLVTDVFSKPNDSESDSSPSHHGSPEDMMEESSNEGEDSVGPDNVEGFRKVHALAAYLVSIGQCDMPLSNNQADEIVKLWNNLDEYDRQPTVFSPRHRTKLVKGRFKSSKKRKSNVIPGLDSTKRCFLGSGGGPAQWPDCNRYVEAVISALCDVHPVRERSSGTTTARWGLICKSYKTIRERVVNNAKVMRETNIQLVEINHTTLSQWYNKREKKKEQEILKQGIRLPQPDDTSKAPLPPAIALPPSLPQVDFPIPFTHEITENTTGKGKGKVRGFVPPPIQHKPAPLAIRPFIPMQHFQSQPHQPASATATQSTESPLNRSQYYYQKRKSEKEAAGVTVRKYIRSDKPVTCSKCKKSRDPDSHKQYFGNWYCQATATVSFENWRDDLKEKKEYKKKN